MDEKLFRAIAKCRGEQWVPNQFRDTLDGVSHPELMGLSKGGMLNTLPIGTMRECIDILHK
jgi:hypothetical protein